MIHIKMPPLYLTTVVSLLMISAVLVSGAPVREKRDPQWPLNEQETSLVNRDKQVIASIMEALLLKEQQAREMEYLEEQLARMAAPPGQEQLARMAAPPGQEQLARMAAPPGQEQLARMAAPPGQEQLARMAAPPGQEQLARMAAPPGQEQLARMAAPPGQEQLARMAAPPGQEMISTNQQDTMEDIDKEAVALIMKMLKAKTMRG